MALRKGRCRLQELLIVANMSQAEFARRMQLSEPTVSKWISGKRQMSFDHAVQAARVLDCIAEDLYEWEEFNKRPG